MHWQRKNTGDILYHLWEHPPVADISNVCHDQMARFLHR